MYILFSTQVMSINSDKLHLATEESLNWGAHVSLRSGFLSVYAQKWDCWVIWQF